MFPVNHISSCCFLLLWKKSSSKFTVCVFSQLPDLCPKVSQVISKATDFPTMRSHTHIVKTWKNPVCPKIIWSNRIHGTGIFINLLMYHKNQPHVGKGTLHGSYGLRCGRWDHLEKKHMQIDFFCLCKVLRKLFFCSTINHPKARSFHFKDFNKSGICRTTIQTWDIIRLGWSDPVLFSNKRFMTNWSGPAKTITSGKPGWKHRGSVILDLSSKLPGTP